MRKNKFTLVPTDTGITIYALREKHINDRASLGTGAQPCLHCERVEARYWFTTVQAGFWGDSFRETFYCSACGNLTVFIYETKDGLGNV